jgi:hypothetical protein
MDKHGNIFENYLKSLGTYVKTISLCNYSELPLTQRSNNLDQNMKNENCCLQFNTYYERHVGISSKMD